VVRPRHAGLAARRADRAAGPGVAAAGIGRGDSAQRGAGGASPPGRLAGPTGPGPRLPQYPGDVGAVADSAVGVPESAGAGVADLSTHRRQAGGDDCPGEDKGTVTAVCKCRDRSEEMLIKYGQCKKIWRVLSRTIDPTRKVDDDERSHQPEQNTDQERESHSRLCPYMYSLRF
jgi:hypothetical protein